MAVELTGDELCNMAWLQRVVVLSLNVRHPIANLLTRSLGKDKTSFFKRGSASVAVAGITSQQFSAASNIIDVPHDWRSVLHACTTR